VAGELTRADLESTAKPGTAAATLRRIAPAIDPATHPRDLSTGQQLALVLAIQLTAAPQVVLLDEPTRGLDYTAKAKLVQVLEELADDGRPSSYHRDVEFAAGLYFQWRRHGPGRHRQRGPGRRAHRRPPSLRGSRDLAPLPFDRRRVEAALVEPGRWTAAVRLGRDQSSP
jgi:hypothetical protein